jgi:hypothetical protein
VLSRNVKVKMNKTIILPVVLYGCGPCSLTLREEHRLRVFENRVLRRIFGPKMEEVARRTSYFVLTPNIIRQIKSRRMKLAGHMARMGEESNVYKVLVGKPEGKRPHERPSHRWEDGIKMDLREIGWECRVDPVGSG